MGSERGKVKKLGFERAPKILRFSGGLLRLLHPLSLLPAPHSVVQITAMEGARQGAVASEAEALNMMAAAAAQAIVALPEEQPAMPVGEGEPPVEEAEGGQVNPHSTQNTSLLAASSQGAAGTNWQVGSRAARSLQKNICSLPWKPGSCCRVSGSPSQMAGMCRRSLTGCISTPLPLHQRWPLSWCPRLHQVLWRGAHRWPS